MTETKWELCLGETTTGGGGAETIAKFISESQIYTKPNVVSATTGDNFSAIAVDNLLATIYDQDVCCVNFKSTIEDIAILAGGYIAVGERNGTLTIGKVEGVGEFKVKQSCLLIPGVEGTRQQSFAQILFQVSEETKTESKARIICLSHQGQLIMFDDIILMNGDIDLSHVKRSWLATPHVKALHFTTIQDRIISVGLGSQCVAVYAVKNGQVVHVDAATVDCEETVVEMVKIQILPKALVFVTLDSEGKFYVWDLYTMIVVYTWTVPGVSDFRLIQAKITQLHSFRLSDMKMLLVNQGKVQTLTLPSLAVSAEHSFGADFAILSKSSKSFNEDEVYVTECNKIEDEDDVETTVYFRCYREISPQKRLQRLIAKKRYEEAENFAKLFGLPFNLDPLIVQRKMREVKESFSEQVMHILHCKEQLLKNKSGDNSVALVLSELEEIEHRLESYRRVYGEEKFSSLEWETFQYENPLTLCSRLVMEDAEKAFKLWTCFQESLQTQLKPGLVQQILQRIPLNVHWQMVVDWFSHSIIPCVVTTDPKAVTSIVHWMEDRVRILEVKEKKTWLDDALKVCQSLLDSLHLAVTFEVDDVTDNNLQILKAKRSCEVAISPLRELVKLLHGLRELRTKYKCHLSLDAFKKESKEGIACKMLDSVLDIHQLPGILMEQVVPYLNHNAIHPDEVFSKYIQDLYKRLDSNHLHSLWEDKVQALMKVISNPKAKVTAAVNLLENATFPLPEFLSGLISDIISAVQHPMVTSLKEKWSIKEADNIMFQYGLDPKKANTTFEAREAAKHVVISGGQVSDARKILLVHKISEEDIELDALKCRLLIESEQLDMLAQYMKLLQKKVLRKCCAYIINIAKEMMTDGNSLVDQKMKIIRIQYYEAAMISASYLKSLMEDWYERKQIEDTIEIIKNVWDLEVFYKIYVNSEFLSDKLRCKETFSKYIYTFNNTMLIGLGGLLNLENGDILEVIISKHSEKLQSQALTKLYGYIAGMYGTFSSMPTVLVHNVLAELSSRDASFSQCLKLTQLYLTHCSQDKFKKAIQICQQAELLRDMSLEGQESIIIEAQGLSDFGFFQDVFPSSKSGGTLSDMIEAAFVATDNDEPLESSLMQIKSLIDGFLKVNHHQLALRILLLSSHRLHSLAVFMPANKSQCYMDVLEKIKKMASSVSSSLIVKIMNAVPMDNYLAQAHLLTLSGGESIPLLKSIIKSCWKDYPKLKRVSMVACAVAEVLDNQELIDSSHGVKIIAKWGSRLSKIGIPFSCLSLMNISEAMEAVSKLVHSPHCNVKILIEFFRDFKLENCKLDTTLMEFFEVCLTAHCEHGLSPAVLTKTEHALLCFEGHSLPVLKKVFQVTHSYNYEVLQFLLEKIQQEEESKETSKSLELLRYLQLYKRCSPPCKLEQTKYSHMFDENGDLGHSLLPETATLRLPFHLLKIENNIWDVISAEINFQTLDLWLEMAAVLSSAVLSLSRDDILMKASTNMIESYIKSSQTSINGDSQELCKVMTQIEMILSRLERMEKAVWWCHFMFKKLPHDEEKTIALQYCVLYAKKWLESADEHQKKAEASKTMERFCREHKYQSTLWALSQAGLNKKKELVKWIKKPDELIQQLYLLPCVIDHKKLKDINLVCDEIADLNEINLLDIRKMLLDKWLAGTSLRDSDQTLTFDVFPEDDSASVRDNINRALYMLKSRDRTDLVQHVVRIASLADELLYSPTRKKAIYCVFKVSTEEEIQDVIDKGI